MLLPSIRFLLANCTTNEKKEIERINDINYSVITDTFTAVCPVRFLP